MDFGDRRARHRPGDLAGECHVRRERPIVEDEAARAQAAIELRLQAHELPGELARSGPGDARLAERAHGVEDEIEGRGACFGRRFQNRGDALRGDFAEESESQVDLRGGHGLCAGEAREGRGGLRQRRAHRSGPADGQGEANRGDALRGDFAEESESQVDLRGGHGLGAGEAREGRADLRQRLAHGSGRPEGKEEAHGYSRKTVANPRKMKNPMLSVTNVRKTLDPTAGSRPKRSMASGMKIPASAATTRFRSIASAITPPSATLRERNQAATPSTPPQRTPFKALIPSSFMSRRRALWVLTCPSASARTMSVVVWLPELPPMPATIGMRAASAASFAMEPSKAPTTREAM